MSYQNDNKYFFADYNGYLVSKGTSDLYTYHTTDYKDAPELFIPERFMDDMSPLFESMDAKIDNCNQFIFKQQRY